MNKPFPHSIYPENAGVFKAEEPKMGRRSIFSGFGKKEETPAEAPATTRGPSMLDRLLGLRRTRREANQFAGAAAVNPKGIAGQAVGLAGQAAMPMIQEIAQHVPAAAGAVSAAAPAPTDLAEMVAKLGAKPSNGTWIIDSSGMARDIHTGLFGIPVEGPSKVIGTLHGIGSSTPSAKIVEIARAARDHVQELSPRMLEREYQQAGGSWSRGGGHVPGSIVDMGRALLAAGISGRMINPQRYVQEALKTIANRGNGAGKISSGDDDWNSAHMSDIVRGIAGEQEGMTIHVLPAELQSKSQGAGTPLTHIPGGSDLHGVIKLQPHEDEGKHFEEIQRALQEAAKRSGRPLIERGIKSHEEIANRNGSSIPIESHDPENFDTFDKLAKEQEKSWKESDTASQGEEWARGEREEKERAKKKEEEKEAIKKRDANRISWSKWRRMNLAERAAATGSPAGIYGPDERYARSMNTLLDSNQQLKKILKKMY